MEGEERGKYNSHKRISQGLDVAKAIIPASVNANAFLSVNVKCLTMGVSAMPAW